MNNTANILAAFAIAATTLPMFMSWSVGAAFQSIAHKQETGNYLPISQVSHKEALQLGTGMLLASTGIIRLKNH